MDTHPIFLVSLSLFDYVSMKSENESVQEVLWDRYVQEKFNNSKFILIYWSSFKSSEVGYISRNGTDWK